MTVERMTMTEGAMAERGVREIARELELAAAPEPRSFLDMAIATLKRDRLTIIAASVLLLFCVVSATASWTSRAIGQDPYDIDVLNNFDPPSREHWLGTDDLGRDQVARLIYGGRVSLLIGVLGAAINLSIGVALGSLAGYFGKTLDDLVMWLITTLNSIPTIFLLLIVAALFTFPWWGLAILIGLLSWTGVARQVRGKFFSLKEQDFVTAARSVGVSTPRIISLHILPNIWPLVFIIMGADIGNLILVESALSYLGLGVQAPTSTWGNMLTKSQSFFSRGPWLPIAPGLAITITVLCLYLVADGLRDALDPRLKEG